MVNFRIFFLLFVFSGSSCCCWDHLELLDMDKAKHIMIQQAAGLKLMFVSVIPDLLSLKAYQVFFLFLFACTVVVFNVLDFNTVSQGQQNISKWENDKDSGIEYWRRVLMCLSGAASFTGAMSVVLTSLGRISCFFWGIINCILYGLYAYAYGYSGDAQLNIMFFLPMQFVGIVQWMDEMVTQQDQQATVRIRSLNAPQIILCLVAALGIIIAFYYEIPAFSIALSGYYIFDGMFWPRVLDASSNGFSIIAQILLLYRYWQSWLFWLTVNFIQMAMFSGVAGWGVDFNIDFMLCLFIINCFYGLKLWYNDCYYGSNNDNDSTMNHTKRSNSNEIDSESLLVVNVNDPLTNTGNHSQANNNYNNNSHQRETSNVLDSYQLNSGVSNMNNNNNSSNIPREGVVIGKFYPFHQGHEYLVQIGLQHCDILHCIVCYKPDEKPSGELRYKWVKELYPNVVVHLLLDVYDPTDSKLWADLTIKTIGKIPYIAFTSEDYGVAYCQHMKSKHYLVDKSRNHVKISGTMVREKPLSHWNYVSKPLRGYYAARFVIVGAESTGKTTLSQILAKKFHTKWVHEYGREYTEDKLRINDPNFQLKDMSNYITNTNTNNKEYLSLSSSQYQQQQYEKLQQEMNDPKAFSSVEWCTGDFYNIASKQNQLEETIARDSNKCVICDTDSFATYIWHEHYMGHREANLLSIFEKLKETTYFPLRFYFLMKTEGVAFVQDGTRDGEYHRDWMFQRFEEELKEKQLPYILLSGGYKDREDTATTFIENILSRF